MEGLGQRESRPSVGHVYGVGYALEKFHLNCRTGALFGDESSSRLIRDQQCEEIQGSSESSMKSKVLIKCMNIYERNGVQSCPLPDDRDR